jgi:hypothetical protein
MRRSIGSLAPLPRLPRRTVLRGLGGIALALPWLEIMERRGAAATAQPLRYAVLYGSYSISPDDDTRQNLIIPDRTGPGYDLKAGLAPLAPVQSEVTVVSNLRLQGVGHPDAGDGIPIHFHNDAIFAGGTQKQSGLVIVYTHPTSDQIVADANGTGTPFPSLGFCVQASPYVTGQVDPLKGTMSARLDANGKPVAITPNASPHAAFASLFGNFQAPGGAGLDPAAALELDERKSVLDYVDRKLGGLHDRLSLRDQERLTQHWDEIRALEQRLAQVGGAAAANPACALPAAPGPDPALGGSIADPNGYDANAGYSDEETRAAAFTDLLALAFACDLTRSATLMHTFVQSFMNAATIAQVDRTVHDAHHQGGPTVDKIARIAAWHMKHFAALIAKLASLPEGNGSVLDSCALVYLNEAGIGVDSNGVPNSHSGEQMMALVAGGAGGLVRGTHLVAPASTRDVANVLMTAMAAVGVSVATLGDVAGGEIPGLRA